MAPELIVVFVKKQKESVYLEVAEPNSKHGEFSGEILVILLWMVPHKRAGS